MHIYSLVLFILTVLSLSDARAVERTTNKIYLRELTTIEKFKPLLTILEKNIYDVIFETKKYELYLLDSKGRNSVYVTNYERLTVDLRENEVQVTLSNKIVVIRRYEGKETPILDLRLALYELFFGKDYLTANKAGLEELSKSRMERLKKLAMMQERIKKNDSKGSQQVVTPSNQVKNPSSSTKRIGAKTTPTQPSPSGEEDKISLQKQNLAQPIPSASKLNKKTSSLGANKQENSLRTNQTNEVSNSKEENKKSSNIVALPQKIKKKQNRKKKPQTQRSFVLTTSLGFLHYKANYSDIISTKTTLNFYTMGIKAQSRLIESHDDIFWNQFDYELGLELLQPLATDNFQAPKGRKIVSSVTTSHINEGLAGGVFFSYENFQLVTLRGVNQGLELVDINFFFLGPEIHYDFSKGPFTINLSGRYKFGLLSSSNFEAQYKANSLSFESTAYVFKNWGLNLKFEQIAIASARIRATGKANADLLQFALIYKFN